MSSPALFVAIASTSVDSLYISYAIVIEPNTTVIPPDKTFPDVRSKIFETYKATSADNSSANWENNYHLKALLAHIQNKLRIGINAVLTSFPTSSPNSWAVASIPAFKVFAAPALPATKLNICTES